MKTIFCFVLALAALQSCTAQNNDPKVSLPKEYEACCGVQPVEFTLKKALIYVPNVFTPNGDGVNDLFYPFVSAEVGEVQGFTVLSAEGDSILFQRATFVYNRLAEFAWNGRRKDGSAYRGKFKYGMRIVSKDNFLRYVEGEACSVLCEPGTKDLKVKKGCFYPSQAGKQTNAGMVDSVASNGEKDCLK